MRSYKFPNMFSSNNSNIWKASEYHKATKQNVYLLMQSEKRELTCDPGFGVTLKHYMFDQNNDILREALIDSIYVQLGTFIKQVYIERSSIKVNRGAERGTIVISFIGRSQIDFELSNYKLILMDDSQME